MADKRINRVKNYADLRAAGFTVEEATRIKGASNAKVQDAIKSKTMPEKVTAKITQGSRAPITSKGYKPPKQPKPVGQHHARTVDYYPVAGIIHMDYLQKYNFIVSYRIKGDDEKHYITISTSKDRYKGEVLEAARGTLAADTSKYNPKRVLVSTLKIEYCIVNPNARMQ